MGTADAHILDALEIRAAAIRVEFDPFPQTPVRAFAAADEYLLALWHVAGRKPEHPPPRADLARLVHEVYADQLGVDGVLAGYRFLQYTASLPAPTEADLESAVSYLLLVEGWTRAMVS